jgi:hypothetical protein
VKFTLLDVNHFELITFYGFFFRVSCLLKG